MFDFGVEWTRSNDPGLNHRVPFMVGRKLPFIYFIVGMAIRYHLF